jgi:hypothetical protein
MSGNRLCHKLDSITHFYVSPRKNFCKYPFFGHDAVSGPVEDGTFFMAFFSDLGDLHKGFFPQPHLLADFLGFPVNTGGGNVFSKIPEIEYKLSGTYGFDAFGRQKTELPVPVTGMGITFDTMVFHQFCLVDTVFGGAFFFADGNGNYFHKISFCSGVIIIIEIYITMWQ